MNAIDTESFDRDEDGIGEDGGMIQVRKVNERERDKNHSTQTLTAHSLSQTQRVNTTAIKKKKNSLVKRAKISNRSIHSTNRFDWNGDCEDVGDFLDEEEENGTESEEYN